MKESSLVVWLRRLIYSSTLVPLIIFSQYISPFHFGKVVVLRAIVEVMLGLYLLLIWRDRSYLPKANPITWAFLAFTLPSPKIWRGRRSALWKGGQGSPCAHQCLF